MTNDRHSEIERRAYFIWNQEGRPDGMALEHWLRAEAEVAREDRPSSTAVQTRSPRRGRATRRKGE